MPSQSFIKVVEAIKQNDLAAMQAILGLFTIVKIEAAMSAAPSEAVVVHYNPQD